HLFLHFPHQVEEKTSKARWISEKRELEITTTINREYDCINE
ncbi:hypothetical protein A3Q56_08681, partial [Intoshia linei]